MDRQEALQRAREFVVLKARQLRAEAQTIRQGLSRRDRWCIAAMLAHSHLREGGLRKVLGWLPVGNDRPREFRLASGLSVTGRRGDGTVFFEQFGLDVYAVPLPVPVHTVVDLGANVGYATLRLSARYPEARLVCVEPTLATRALLADNVARNGLDAQVYGVAVVAEPGTYAVDAGGHFGGNKVTGTPDGGIEGITLVELLDRAEVDVVDLLKVDIEGGERELFSHAGQWAPRVRSIIAELHDGLTRDDAERWLSPHGFHRRPLPSGLGCEDLICFTRER